MKRLLLLPVLLALVQASFGATTASQSMHVVTSTSGPHFELKIDAAILPVAPLSFPLDFTNVTRRIFVDADRSKTVRRLIVIQFESVKKGSNFRFVYPPKPPIVFGKHTYRFGAYIYNDAKDAAAAPDMEAARTRATLERQGYRLPRLLRTARLSRVADPQGLSEVIIFYNESADAAYPTGLLPNADSDGDLPLSPSAARSLFEALRSIIRPVEG